MTTSPLNPLTLSATKAREMLQAGKVTSVDLVELYLSQIERHNNQGAKLNAIIQVAPHEMLMEKARQLDQERASKKIRGPLHGVPIIVKDAFLTPSLGMGTTCGSFALKDQHATEDAAVIKLLVKAGMIVISKANLSEWEVTKRTISQVVGPPWVARIKTQSPYIRVRVVYPTPFLGHSTPAGSSSGSAVGVAAGFAPLALGAETDGSVVQPANRAAVYGLKANHGSTKMSGVMPGASSLDCLGAFAKTPHDLADLMSIIMEQPFESMVDTRWTGMRVGFVETSLWRFPDTIIEQVPEFHKQLELEITAARKTIANSGADVVYPAQLMQYNELFADIAGVDDVDPLIAYEFPRLIEDFLKLFPNAPVRTLSDLIKFNDTHATGELPAHQPTQDRFIDMNNDKTTQEQFDSILAKIRSRATSEIDRTLKENNIDVILGPGDARFCSFAGAAGGPVASLPLGFANFNGRAFGVHALARPGEEQKLLQVMAAWETAFPDATKPPSWLVEQDEAFETKA